MYYLIKDWKISWSSELPLSSQWYETIQKDFTQEEIEKLNSWYLYINWEIVEWPEVKEFEKQKLEAKKQEILKELWSLKQIKDWLELVWEDTTEIDLKIEELKKEYKSL
jgi:hypothetical protein